MLKKILEDGVCPQEILDNITDEDKQLIFLEIRKEQIRKYKLWLKADEDSLTFRHTSNKKGKNVGFSEENQLVSFLGEREGDKPVEELLREEALRKAQQEAEIQILKELELSRDCPDGKVVNPKLDAPLDKLSLKIAESHISEPTTLKPNPPELSDKPIIKRLSKSAEQKRQELVKRKSTELYQTYINEITKLEESALKENEEITKYWVKAEEQAKLDEEQRRKLAEEARKLHAHINMDLASDSIEEVNVPDLVEQKTPPKLPSKKSDHLRMVINTIQKSNMARSQQEIKSWFIEHEWNKLRVFDGTKDTVPEWFHGIISREQTEHLLEKKAFGNFLIRLSDKFRCYVLSYKGKLKIKHILIESQMETSFYKFCGPANRITFRSLSEMIAFFRKRPISDSNQEILTDPCGQEPGKIPDYMRLIMPDCNNSKSSSVVCSL